VSLRKMGRKVYGVNSVFYEKEYCIFRVNPVGETERL